MRRLTALTLAALCCAGGCSDEPGGDQPDLMEPGPPLDPQLFDCSSPGAQPGGAPPARSSSVPIACALDPGCRTLQISGHRGAGGELGRIAPEDTLSAYRAAIALGIEYVETDPRPTKDGVIVNLHDPTVDRTTNGTGNADQLTFAEIRALSIDPGRLQGDFSCDRVPTLEELLRTCRGSVVVLVDANKTDRVDLLVQAIQAADALDWAVFDTSSIDKIDRALAIEPRLKFQIRPSTVDEVTVQLDHFAPLLPVLVEVGAVDRAGAAPVVHARGTRVFSDLFDGDILATVTGDLSYYHMAFDDGVDVGQTDRPELVLGVLRARGARKE